MQKMEEYRILKESVALFLRMGVTAFGGPLVHTAIIHEEVVRNRKWISEDDFRSMVAISNLVPGPNSTELVMHVGYRRCGWPGLFLCGLAFIVPSVCVVASLAWAYRRWGALPETSTALLFVQPVVVAIALFSFLPFWRRSLGRPREAILFVGCAIASAMGAREIVILLAAGGVAALAPLVMTSSRSQGESRSVLPLPALFLAFLEIGAVLYGSGYVLIAYVERAFGPDAGLLSSGDVLAAIAAGQITPGPLFSSAGFVGYLLHGWSGAWVASAGLFLPAFLFVACSAPFCERLLRVPALARFVEGAATASFALLLVVLAQMGFKVFGARPELLPVCALALLALFRRANPTLIVAAAAILGWAWALSALV
jgi:chromate transporter